MHPGRQNNPTQTNKGPLGCFTPLKPKFTTLCWTTLVKDKLVVRLIISFIRLSKLLNQIIQFTYYGACRKRPFFIMYKSSEKTEMRRLSTMVDGVVLKAVPICPPWVLLHYPMIQTILYRPYGYRICCM